MATGPCACLQYISCVPSVSSPAAEVQSRDFHALIKLVTATVTVSCRLQKFNAMIYLPFREDARIVHMHGCVLAPAVLRTKIRVPPRARGVPCCCCYLFFVCCFLCLYRVSKEVAACLCFHLRPKPNHYLEWLQTTRCKFRDFCTLVSGSSR